MSHAQQHAAATPTLLHAPKRQKTVELASEAQHAIHALCHLNACASCGEVCSPTISWGKSVSRAPNAPSCRWDLTKPPTAKLAKLLECAPELDLPQPLIAQYTITGEHVHEKWANLLLCPAAKHEHEGRPHATVCANCADCLKRDHLPKFAVSCNNHACHALDEVVTLLMIMMPALLLCTWHGHCSTRTLHTRSMRPTSSLHFVFHLPALLPQIRNGLYIGDASLVDELKGLTQHEWLALQQAYAISVQRHLHAYEDNERVRLVGHTSYLPLDPPLLAKAAAAALQHHTPPPNMLVHMTTNVSGHDNLKRAIKRALRTEPIAINPKRIKQAHDFLAVNNSTHPCDTPALDLDANGVPKNTFYVTANKHSATPAPTTRKRKSASDHIDTQINHVSKQADKTPAQFAPGVAAGRSTLIHTLPTISHLHHPTAAVQATTASALMYSAGTGLVPSWQPQSVTRIHGRLFPFGRGGPDEPRSNAISMHAYVAHTLRLHRQTFPSDSQWILERYSTLQRKMGQSQLKLSIKAGHNQIKKVPLVSFKAAANHMDNVSKCLKSGKPMPAIPPEATKDAMQVVSSLKYCRGQMKGSYEHAQLVRAKAYALLETFGSLSLWNTITPNDVTMPNFVQHCKLDGTVLIESADFCTVASSITQAVNANAGATAFQYDQVINIMITYFFGWKDGKPTKRGGIFGHLLCYMLITEEQQRLTLHGHAMLWVKNFPSTIRDFIESLKSRKFVDSLIQYIDRIQKCSHGIELTDIINDHDHNHLGSGECTGLAAHMDMDGHPEKAKPNCTCSHQCKHARGCDCAAQVMQRKSQTVTTCLHDCPCKKRNKPCTSVCACTPACCANQPCTFHDYLMPPSTAANAITINTIPASYQHMTKPIKGTRPPPRVQCTHCGHSTSAEDLLIDWALTQCTQQAKQAFLSGDRSLATVPVDLAALVDDTHINHSTAMANLTLTRLAVQCHDPGHRKSCFKNKKKESKSSCRFHYPRKTVQHTTLLVNGSKHHEDGDLFQGGHLIATVTITDIAAVEIDVRRTEGSEYLNSHNDMHLAIMKSNSDVQVCLGNPGVAHYITTYACKCVFSAVHVATFLIACIAHAPSLHML